MNANQRQNILDAIVEFEKVDFETPFKNKYKDTATVDSIFVADYSIAELFVMAKRAISQLKEFLENGNWQIIPSDNLSIPSYGNITLRNVIVNITAYFNSASYEQAVTQIKPLVYYEMQCGFWDQPKRIELGIRESSLKILEQRAKLTITHIDARETKVNSLIQELEGQKIEIENLIKTKKQELEILKSNQFESNTILESIKNTQKNANIHQDAIETLNGKANNIVTALESAQNHIQEQIKVNEDTISQSKQALEDFKEDAETKISKITSDFESVSNNAEEVREMMHFIKDGALAHSFNKRKEDIRKSVIVWQWLSVGSAILMGVWIFVVFKCLNTNIAAGSVIENSAAIVFANLFINIAKTSPMIVLFWFVLAQYKKERNLLEEYVFREAVAATLTAYLDQLNGETDNNRCTLLMNTVEKLYTKPTISRDEVISISLKSKDIADTVKHVKECVKE